jgi:hypothetical protein
VNTKGVKGDRGVPGIPGIEVRCNKSTGRRLVLLMSLRQILK